MQEKFKAFIIKIQKKLEFLLIILREKSKKYLVQFGKNYK